MAHISKVKYLGYTFYRYKGKCRFRVHPKSVAKMKNRIRELTDRNKGISNEVREKKYQEYVRGWVDGRMGKTQNPSGLLETMEENQNKVWNAKGIRLRELESQGISQ